MARETYYVNIGTKEISRIPYGNNIQFVVEATPDELTQLRTKMNEMSESDSRTFFRAHVPIIPYHLDTGTQAHDEQLRSAYQLIYDLATEETRDQMKQMAIW